MEKNWATNEKAKALSNTDCRVAGPFQTNLTIDPTVNKFWITKALLGVSN